MIWNHRLTRPHGHWLQTQVMEEIISPNDKPCVNLLVFFSLRWFAVRITINLWFSDHVKLFLLLGRNSFGLGFILITVLVSIYYLNLDVYILKVVLIMFQVIWFDKEGDQYSQNAVNCFYTFDLVACSVLQQGSCFQVLFKMPKYYDINLKMYKSV